MSTCWLIELIVTEHFKIAVITLAQGNLLAVIGCSL